MITGKTKSVPASIRFLFQYESAAWKLLVSKCCEKITIEDLKDQLQFFIKKKYRNCDNENLRCGKNKY